jgi:predicted Zn-dependent protease
MKPVFLVILLSGSLSGYTSGTSLPFLQKDPAINQPASVPFVTALPCAQQLRSAAQEIRRSVSTNRLVDIHVLFEKLVSDSSHFYFNVDELTDYASTLIKQQVQTAIRILNETLRLFPKSIETAVLLGEAYEETGNRYLARQVYEEAMALKPDPTLTYILLKKLSLLISID